MIKFKYSLKNDYPEWTGCKEIDEDNLMKQLNIKELIDKIILTIETYENDEVIKFELTGK